MSSNQSSYRPALAPKYGGWKEREAAKQRAREEADRLRKEAEQKARLAVNETNFPALGQEFMRTSVPMYSTSFADLAEEWKVKDEMAEAREQLRKERENRERVLMNGVYVMSRSGYSDSAIEPLPTIVEPKKKGPTIEADGFQVVENRKTRKEKRELTEAELHRKYLEAGSESDNEEEAAHNPDLFDNYRRDHY
jgi:hypothetical protein